MERIYSIDLINLEYFFKRYNEKKKNEKLFAFRERMIKSIKRFIKNLKYFAGIIHGSKAFIGPYHLQIMLTNDCKAYCTYCPNYSLLRKKSKSKEWMEQKLDFNKVKEIIDDGKKIGAEEIVLTGGGEPFLYPKIYEAIEYIKKKGLKCTLVTNGMHIDRKNIKRLFKLKVDKILLNIFSGSIKNNTTPPIQNKADWLLYLKKLKKNKKSKLPYVSLVSIISKINYKDINRIFDFGENKGADEILLKATRLTKDTKSLSLTKEQCTSISKCLSAMKTRIRLKNNIDQFIRQIMHKSYLKGRTDREFPKRAPCYIGWISTEVLANGNVIPCCASSSQIIGNVNFKGFKEIWYSKEYNLFRKNSRRVKKNKTLKSACMSNISSETLLSNNCILYSYNIYTHRILRPFDYIRILKEEDKYISKII